MVPKIKAYYEGIPLTTAEGSSTIEDIDMETIGSIEIIKGPNSTSFGSGGWRYQSVCSRFPWMNSRLNDLWKLRTFETKFSELW
jgi:hypothetical protein